MSTKHYHRLKDLRPGSYNWTIKVRIIRLWRGALISGEVFKSLNMLLLDDKNTRMQAFVPAAVLETHEPKLEEGSIYTLSNFTVKDYKSDEKFRVVNFDRQIVLTNYTKVEKHAEDDTVISKNLFDFYDLGDLIEIANKNVYLTDVVGVILKDSPLRKIKNKTDQVKFTIVDGRCSVDVTLWDLMAKEFVLALENAEEFPPIIIIASAKINSWQGTNHTTPQVDISNCSATRFYLNYDHHTVSHLRRMISTPLFSNYDFCTEKRDIVEFLSIEKIQKLNKEYSNKEIVCEIKITTLPPKQKWYYYECPSCYKEISPREGLLSCYRCNREVPHPYKKFQVYIRGEDCTGEIDICLFDRAIKTIIGKNVQDLIDEGAVDEEVPPLLQTLENLVLKVKVVIKSQNIEKTSNLYYGMDVSGKTMDTVSETCERMEISATQTSTSTYHLDDLSQLTFKTPEVPKKKRTSKNA